MVYVHMRKFLLQAKDSAFTADFGFLFSRVHTAKLCGTELINELNVGEGVLHR